VKRKGKRGGEQHLLGRCGGGTHVSTMKRKRKKKAFQFLLQRIPGRVQGTHISLRKKGKKGGKVLSFNDTGGGKGEAAIFNKKKGKKRDCF